MTAVPITPSWTGSLRMSANGAVSSDAEQLRGMLQDATTFAGTQSVAEPYQATLHALEAAAREASEPGWDGYNARAVTALTVRHAKTFLRLLPSTVRSPEVAVHPDGDIEFEWHVRPRWVFTVAVGGSGYLNYAGLFGHSRTHGREYLVESLPEAVAMGLRRLFQA